MFLSEVRLFLRASLSAVVPRMNLRRPSVGKEVFLPLDEDVVGVSDARQREEPGETCVRECPCCDSGCWACRFRLVREDCRMPRHASLPRRAAVASAPPLGLSSQCQRVMVSATTRTAT